MPKTSMNSVRRPAAHEVFTDRDSERERLRSFFESLCASPMARAKPILAFYGVGGVGKTSVKNEAIRQWRGSKGADAARLAFADCNVDSDEFTPAYAVMGFFGNVLRPALRRAGFTLPLFETFYCTWFGRSNPDTEMSKSSLFSTALGIGEESADLGSRLIEGLDALGSTFRGTALAFKAATAFRDWRRQRALADTLPELDLNSLTLKQFHELAGEVLAVDLLTELGRDPAKALCIVVDGFERIQSREMRADLQQEFQDFCARLLLSDPPVRCGVVILGRERLRWRELYDEPDDQTNHWDLYIEHSLLGGLAQSDARDFMRQVASWYQRSERSAVEQRVGRLVSEHLDAVLRQAEEDPESTQEPCYHPYSLDLAVEYVIEHQDRLDPAKLAVGAKALQARLLRDMDRRQRSALYVLAVALEFDAELFRHLVLEGLIVDYPVQGLHELVTPSYVIEDADRPGTYRFHRKMLEALLTDLIQQPGGQEQFAQIVETMQEYLRAKLVQALATDLAHAAKIYDRASSILTDHAFAGRLMLESFERLSGMLTDVISKAEFAYFNLEGRIQTVSAGLQLMKERVGAQHPKVANSLNELGRLLRKQGDYAAARPVYERALDIRERTLGPEHLETSTSLNNLAGLLRSQGEYAAARLLLERALAVREKALGAEHPITATSLNGLAAMLSSQGDYRAARRLYERSLAVRENVLGGEHPDTATSLNNLATVLRSLGEYAAARPLLERALTIREKILGTQHPETAWSLNSLAGLLVSQGEYAAARPLYERAIAIREDVLGLEHPDTASSLSSLAGLHSRQGDFATAMGLYERALAIRERVLGAHHPDTAACLNSLANLRRAQGDYDGARALYERALAVREATLGGEHPVTAATLNGLALLLSRQGELAPAQMLFERALAIRERSLGLEHPETATSLDNLAGVVRRQGDFATARPLLERALEIREKVLGPEHPTTATSLNNLALLLSTQGELSAARSLFERAIEICEKVLGPCHVSTAACLNNLAAALVREGDHAAAKPLLERALAIREKLLGPEHPDTATSLSNLAIVANRHGEKATAESLLERALAILIGKLGTDHGRTQAVYRALEELREGK